MGDVLPWIVGVLAALVAGLQLALWWRMRRAVGRRLEGLPAGRRLYYFHSPRCGPCRGVTPVVARLAAERGDVELVDVSAEPETARRFGVLATPAFVLVEGGRVVQVLVGAQSERRLRALLGA
ncbi:thioredoxin family protein [Inmirania thermothiophila]|uniref:Thioredoxin 1 n=1 Tax=Inmirania thermothiophila TaxID=1750597 RepID=A0A3N1Y8E7_9GAMM|nr:thioredoxin family protein [Inmirania thermothiophila]ROR35045.1 thioredoxin 1 [Inmirania thermothiophila]